MPFSDDRLDAPRKRATIARVACSPDVPARRRTRRNGMWIAPGLELLALVTLVVVLSERAERRRAAVRVWYDDWERRLAAGHRTWPLE